MDVTIELRGWELLRRRWPARWFLGRTKRGRPLVSERRHVHLEWSGDKLVNTNDIEWASDENNPELFYWNEFALVDIGVGDLYANPMLKDHNFVVARGDLTAPPEILFRSLPVGE